MQADEEFMHLLGKDCIRICPEMTLWFLFFLWSLPHQLHKLSIQNVGVPLSSNCTKRLWCNLKETSVTPHCEFFSACPADEVHSAARLLVEGILLESQP